MIGLLRAYMRQILKEVARKIMLHNTSHSGEMDDPHDIMSKSNLSFWVELKISIIYSSTKYAY